MLLPLKIQLWTHQDKQGITSNGLMSDPISISCYVMPIRVILHMMDAFCAGCYSGIPANVSVFMIFLSHLPLVLAVV